MAYRLLARARADIQAIRRHIAADNPRAALRWVDEIEARVAVLGRMPGIGAPRRDLRPDLRTWTEGSYIILYLHQGDDALILRVVHGARRWERLVR